MANRFHDVDGLQIERWALAGDTIPPLNLGPAGDITPGALQALLVGVGARKVPMKGSAATGTPLVSNGNLGVDVVRVPAGKGFEPHTHPGDHILVVVGGQGTITYDGKVYPTQAGEVYMIDGSVPHGVGARTDHVILAVGAPHKPVGSDERMAPVEYAAVASATGTLQCLICEREPVAEHPRMLHDEGCPHCPCRACVS